MRAGHRTGVGHRRGERCCAGPPFGVPSVAQFTQNRRHERRWHTHQAKAFRQLLSISRRVSCR